MYIVPIMLAPYIMFSMWEAMLGRSTAKIVASEKPVVDEPTLSHTPLNPPMRKRRPFKKKIGHRTKNQPASARGRAKSRRAA
jgi:hypothetical protein